MNRSVYLDDYVPLARQGVFRATTNAHGLYNTFQFVLRLSPAVHRKLASMPNGIHSSSDVDFEAVQAFSTYLHETIHWWQHIGSTYGLMLSMSYPAQAHANYSHLKSFVDLVGFQKSVRQFAEQNPPGGYGTTSGIANIIINNHYDIEAFRSLTVSPLGAEKTVHDPLFENVAHAYHIAYGNIISLISSVSDREFRIIPHPQSWGEPLRLLREKKEEGFHYGSPIKLYPTGAYEIFEGQARFAQLQYLYFASGGRFDLQDADSAGMLGGVYGKAFQAFLQLCELERPSSIDHPNIALFLLICDIAINPGSAFPFPLTSFPTLVHDLDPGARFTTACRLARLKCPEVFDAITEYSREDYDAVSTKLCKEMIEAGPLCVAAEFVRWWAGEEFASLRAEYETYRFKKGNVSVRILLAHFMAFMEDKYAKPEVFCWPGAWMAGRNLSQDVVAMFDRHGALFVDKEHDDGIFPRMPLGRSEANVQESFDDFYANNIIFDLTRQWISEPGAFRFGYRWLTQNGTEAEIQAYAEGIFESIYNVRPSAALLL